MIFTKKILAGLGLAVVAAGVFPSGADAADRPRRVIRAPGAEPVWVAPEGEISAPAGEDFFQKPATSGLRIFSRAEWGADENLRLARAGEPVPEPTPGAVSRTFLKNGQRLAWPIELAPRVERIVVHHTASTNLGNFATDEARIREIYRLHAVTNGWGDIGYHYLIAPDGRIFEGKAGGDRAVGGHVRGHNLGSLGIALLGNFGNEFPTEAALRSLENLAAEKAREHGLDLARPGVLTGHRDWNATACPGDALEPALPRIARGDDPAMIFAGLRRTVALGAKSPATVAVKTSAPAATPAAGTAERPRVRFRTLPGMTR